MRPTRGNYYWIATLFSFEYEDGEVYRLRSYNVAKQEAYSYYGICLEAGEHQSVMGLLNLDYQGLPQSKNRFVFSNYLIFEHEEQSRKCSEYLLNRYLEEFFDERFSVIKTLWETVEIVHKIHEYAHDFYDWYCK